MVKNIFQHILFDTCCRDFVIYLLDIVKYVNYSTCTHTYLIFFRALAGLKELNVDSEPVKSTHKKVGMHFVFMKSIIMKYNNNLIVILFSIYDYDDPPYYKYIFI